MGAALQQRQLRSLRGSLGALDMAEQESSLGRGSTERGGAEERKNETTMARERERKKKREWERKYEQGRAQKESAEPKPLIRSWPYMSYTPSCCEPLYVFKSQKQLPPYTRTKPVTERSLESLAAFANEAAALLDCVWRRSGAG